MGSAGQGSLSVSAKAPVVAPPGPPFPANSAYNGVSVDPVTGQIVLGNDLGSLLAQLVSDREIDHDGNLFQFLQRVPGPLQSRTLLLDPANGLYGIGDYDGLFGNTSIHIDDNLQTVDIFGGGGRMVALDRIAQQYSIGDVDNSDTGVRLFIDDSIGQARIRSAGFTGMLTDFVNGLYVFGQDTAVNGTILSINDAAQFTQIRDTLGEMMTLDRASSVFAFGDPASVGNGNTLQITDISNLTQLKNSNVIGLRLDYAAMLFQLGDIGGFGNNTIIEVDDANEQVKAQTATGTMINVSNQSFRYRIGDIDAVNNGAVLDINDSADVFRFNNTASNVGIEINGVTGFTGTVTPVTSITVNGGIVTNVA